MARHLADGVGDDLCHAYLPGNEWLLAGVAAGCSIRNRRLVWGMPGKEMNRANNVNVGNIGGRQLPSLKELIKRLSVCTGRVVAEGVLRSIQSAVLIMNIKG